LVDKAEHGKGINVTSDINYNLNLTEIWLGTRNKSRNWETEKEE